MDADVEDVAGLEAPALSKLETLRHSTAHVMAYAVKNLFPDAKVTIGPSIETGFYYDFHVARPFTDEDLVKIEVEMANIVKADHVFERREVSREEAREFFEGQGETFKVEILDAIPPESRITIYKCGEFQDLCRGPHVERTSQIKAFKLLSVAGAYWRGDERRPMLQRIYGTAFPDPKALRLHLAQIEEAKKRDHRKLGKELDLFSIQEQIGGGLVLWHPKGARIRTIVEDFWRHEHFENGYEMVFSPHVAKEDLWNVSGHTSFYKENMFSGMDVEGKNYLVKPMNCPYHVTIFKQGMKSYRDLPMRYAELGTVYRYERSGVLQGLLRVRGFTQDDAHIFMRKDQLADELGSTLKFCLYILKTFGFTDFKLYFATRPAKFVGEVALWDEAEAALLSVLKGSGIEFEIDKGGGAFYGPKIDLKLRDAIGREWQCSTIQVDFQLPERFDLTYVGDDGAKHRVVMIHRALLGSVERFFAVLVEHHAGAFPSWLAPIQARVVSVSEKQAEWGAEVLAALKAKGIRADIDVSSDKLGAKIRRAQLEKIPFMLVCGDREAETRTVSPRRRTGENMPAMALPDLLTFLAQEAQIPRGGVGLTPVPAKDASKVSA